MSELRARLAVVRASAYAHFDATLKAEPVCRTLAAASDAALIELWPNQALSDCHLIATGGYGRGRLFPASDIDVLILVPSTRSSEREAALRAFLAAAWDLQLDLAHSVRTIEEWAAFVDQDLSGFTAALDARVLAGAPEMATVIAATLARSRFTPAAFFAAKLDETHARHAKHADTAHNLEPNLKNGPGALRDLDTLRWIGMRCAGVHRPADWVREGLAERDEMAALRRAEQWLMDLRFALHRQAGRREERVLFDHQKALAARFVKPKGSGFHPVEALMQRYFRAAGDVDRLFEALTSRIEQRLFRPSRAWLPIAGSARLALDADVIEALPGHPGLARAADLIEPFVAIARIDGPMRLGPKLAHAIARAPKALRASLKRDRDAQEQLELILRSRHPYPALTELHRHRLLGELIPAFARVTGRMQYDLFHVYTVDQHTLFLTKHLQQFFVPPDDPEFALAHELMLRVRQPELLFLSALFHDIAKGRGGDHSTLGAKDVRRYLKLMGAPKADIDLCAWLVEQHLLMSITAQKQDIQDPEVVRKFAVKVGDWERLECLYLLTVADIRATNPKLWNGWKARLLSDLYKVARVQLRKGGEALDRRDRIAATRLRALELLTGEGVMFSTVEALWLDFPEQSFWRYSPDQLRWLTHAIIASGRPGKPLIAVRSVGQDGTREIFVRMQDQDGIFATIASTLDRMDLSVIAARVMTCKSGLTLDTFQVLDLRKEAQDAMTRNQEIQMALTMALSERPLKPKLARRRSTREERLFRFPPHIEFEQRVGENATQLMLVCPDRPGLLASVAHAFRDAGVRVQSARIATFGERAEDFFAVAGPGGEALSEGERERLLQALSARLETQ